MFLTGNGNTGAVDGIYGNNTESALIAFQRQAGLQPTGKPYVKPRGLDEVGFAS